MKKKRSHSSHSEKSGSHAKILPQKSKSDPIFLAALGLAVIGIIIYWNSLTTSFIFDDTNHITGNPRIQRLGNLGAILSQTNRPLVDLSLAVNYALGGTNPVGYHIVNLIIHILSAVIFMLIVRHSLRSPAVPERYHDSAFPIAFVTALLWMAHPLQTQGVTYIIQRSESLMGLFYLLVLYCVIRSSEHQAQRAWGVGAIIFCFLGMGTKEVMVTVPLVVLIYDRIFSASSWRDIKRQRGWIYFGLAASWVVLLKLIFTARENSTNAGFGFAGITPVDYALTQAGVISYYLSLMIWPAGQCLDYAWPIVKNVGEALPFVGFIGLLIVLTALAARRYPTLAFLGLWFFMILAPTSSFFPIGDVAFEHRMYLPSMSVVILIVVAAEFFLQKIAVAGDRRYVTCVLVVAGVGILGGLTLRRNHDYRSEAAMWSDVVRKSPHNDRAHLNLGNALAKEKELGKAVEHYKQGLKENPYYEKLHYNLAGALSQQGQEKEAEKRLEESIRLNPDFAEAHNQLGILLAKQGKFDEARLHFKEVIRLEPEKSDSYNNYGLALAKQGQDVEAITYYKMALTIDPEDVTGHYDMALSLAESGQIDEAIKEFQKVLQLQPRHVTANFNLGNMFAQKENFQKAISYYAETVRLKPDFGEAQQRLKNAEMVAKQLSLKEKNLPLQ